MSGVVRCGLDMIHEEHEHPLGYCDGNVIDPASAAPGDDIRKAFVVSAVARPANWASLTLTQARDLRELIDSFVTHYNQTYAVVESEIIPACWPLHPGLAHELAALYALWVHLFQSGLAPADQVMGWHDRWLPGFQTRLAGHLLGTNTMRCTPGRHRSSWNAAAAKIDLEATRTGLEPERLAEMTDDALRAYVGNPAHLE